MRKVVIVILMMLYIFNIGHTSLPDIVGGKLVLGLIGIPLFLFDTVLQIRRGFSIVYWRILIWFLIYCLIAMFSLTYNVTNDYSFFRNFEISFCNFFGCYLIARVGRKEFTSVDRLFIFIIITIAIEYIIAFLIYTYPSVQQFFLPLQKASEDVQKMYEFRVIGLGVHRWVGVLPSCMLGIGVCIYLINKAKQFKDILFLLIGLFIIGFVGFFTAKTSIGLIGIGVLYYFAYLLYRNNSTKFIKTIVFIPLIFGVLLLSINGLLTDSTQDWALGFLKGQEDGTLNRLKEWNEILTFNVKQILIGDGWFEDPINKSAFYMHTDIGYYRETYYTGLFGLISFFMIHIVTLFGIKRYTNTINMRYLLYAMLLMFAVSFFKGHMEVINSWLLILVPIETLRLQEK